MKIKTSLLTLTLLAAIALPASAQQTYVKDTNGNFVPFVLNTNSSGPFLSGPAMNLLSTLSTGTNWGGAVGGIYAPATQGHKAQPGAFALFLYNLNTYMAAGLGIDYLGNQTTMPSCQFQFQLPFWLGGTNGLRATPFAGTGIAIPVSGMGNDNGTLVGLFLAGLDVKVYGGFGLFYAIEQRTGQPGPWHLLGFRYSAAL